MKQVSCATYEGIDAKVVDVESTLTKRYSLTFRSIKKIQKVSRTIADLQSSEVINKEHILEALSYRRR